MAPSETLCPWAKAGAAQALKYLNLVPQGTSEKLFGRLAAALELISRNSLTYTRPAYGIAITGSDNAAGVDPDACALTSHRLRSP